MTVRIDTIGDWSNSDHIDGKGKHQQTPPEPLLLSLCFRFLQKGKREELLKLTVVHFLPSGVHSKFIWGGTEKAVEVKIGDESKSGASCSKIEKGNQKSHKSAIFLWFAKSQNLDRERKEVFFRSTLPRPVPRAAATSTGKGHCEAGEPRQVQTQIRMTFKCRTWNGERN